LSWLETASLFAQVFKVSTDILVFILELTYFQNTFGFVLMFETRFSS